jgi:hypothetical protein
VVEVAEFGCLRSTQVCLSKEVALVSQHSKLIAMIILLIITAIATSFVLFDKACKKEWANEDIEILITEGTGHD